MPSSQPSRSLAAIVFTDVVGYSALVHRDDANAMRLVQEHFALMRGLATRFGGRVIKTIGDSVHLEFASAQAATACSLAAQQAHQQRNARVGESGRFDIRIGVHLGDVEHRDGDIYGDGVNIAARLQPLAPIGGIAISDHVRGQLREELRGKFSRRGAQDLRNIATPVEVFEIEAPAIAQIEMEAPPASSKKSATLRLPIGVALVALGVMVLAGALFLFWRHGTGDAMVVDDKSIAVLPFSDLSPAHDQEYFADGMAEELLNALAKVKGLKVAGRTSSFYFKGKNEDMRVIGKALSVAHVLEGSVRTQGDKVRITAQLIRADNGFHLWSETYDGDLTDVFDLQERIARAITGQLQVVLQGEQQERLVPVATGNPEAYALYLQASEIFNRRDGQRWPEAIAQLEKAVELDPNFARAHARLASVAALSPLYMKPPVPIAVLQKHAQRASELEPGLGEPHAALGQSLSMRREFIAARLETDRALELEPDDITANLWAGVARVRSGYGRRGYQLLDHVLELDPLLPNALNWRGTGYVFSGDLVSGERLLRKAAEAKLTFADIGLAEVAARQGRPEQAVNLLAVGFKALQIDLPDDVAQILARGVYGDTADRANAVAWIDRYLATQPQPVMGVVVHALLHMDQPERALAASVEATSNDAIYFGWLWSPVGTSARRLPMFSEYLRKVGVTQEWDRYGEPDLCHRRAGGEYVCE